jgi:uncharacterized protein YaiE (UPF0345 family)
MNTATLRPSVADAIERELAALGTPGSQLQRNQRHARRVAAALGTFAGAVLLTGGAIVAIGFPGETTTTPIGSVVSGTYTGTASVDLGAVPAGAGAVILDVTCIQGGGVIEVPLNGRNADSVSWDCDVRKDTTHIIDGKLPDPGTTTITITADPGTQWSVTAQYASASTTEWGVNENGQTYGVPNENGLPDLSPALATNGEVGYIFNREVLSFREGEEGFINVYESDGTTVIGQFFIGNS